MSTRAEPVPVSPLALRDWPLPRPSGSKRSRGRVVVLGGSPSTPGAVMLAGLAALRVGAGVLALGVARSVAAPVSTALPEASVTGLPELDGHPPGRALGELVGSADAVLVGCGIDEPDGARGVLRAALTAAAPSTPLVLDAFALGVLPAVLDGDDLGGRAVLTPNTAEVAFLLEVDHDDVADREPLDVATEVAARFAAVVTFQGHIAAPDGRRWTVPTGHAGLGTSGSGDVLAGAVAGLLARGAEPAQAACWGTYLHATSGDRLAARIGRLGFLARELVGELPLVLVETEA